MSNLYLQTWGGLGARINVVLSALYGLQSNNLPHRIKLHWPLATQEALAAKGPKYWRQNEADGHTKNRERLFGANLSDLYDIDAPIEYITGEEFATASQKELFYTLDYTQAPSRNPLFRGQIHFNTQPHDEDFVIQGHQWMNIDGLHHRVLPRFKNTFDRYFKLKTPMAGVVRGMLKSFNEHTVGVYIRSATIHPAVGPWDATGRMREMMRQKIVNEDKTKFFVCADDPNVMEHLKQEFPGRILHTVKPNKFNDPEEMRCVTADIELMRHTTEFYPTWFSGLGILMQALRGKPVFDRYGNTTSLGGANFVKDPNALCHPPGNPLVDGGWIFAEH